MNSACRFVLTVCLVVCFSLIGAAQSTAPARGKSLADIARESRVRRDATGPAAKVFSPSSQEPEERESQDTRDVEDLLAQNAFADLDTAADRARLTKERLEGGVWKL